MAKQKVLALRKEPHNISRQQIHIHSHHYYITHYQEQSRSPLPAQPISRVDVSLSPNSVRLVKRSSLSKGNFDSHNLLCATKQSFG